LQFSDIKWSEFVGNTAKGSDWPFDTTRWTDVPAEPKPFSITLDDNGLFRELKVPSGASIFERNLMRGWASALQINTQEIRNGARGFRSREKSINGECDVTYSVSPQAVRKTVSHVDDCVKRVHRLIDDYRSMRCDGKTTENGPGYPSSVASTVFKLKMEGDRPRIVAIAQQGTFVAQFFEEEGAAHIVHTNQTSVLLEKKSSSNGISVSGDVITDLDFEWADADYTWNQNRNLKAKEPFFATGSFFEDSDDAVKQVILRGIEGQKTIIQQLSTDEQKVQNAHKYGINAIFPAMMALDYNSLKSIADQLFADKSEAGVTKSNIFGELLGSTGTTASALVIKDLLKEGKFDNPRDAARILTAIPFHIRRPNTQLVNEFAELLQMDSERMVKQTVPLMFGHLVRVTCARAGTALSDESKECFRTFASEWVQKFWRRFQATSDRKEKGLIMAAIGNIRFGGMSTLLKPLIMGKTDERDDIQLRNQALYAASWEILIKGESVSFFLPIFANADFGHELRISALEMLLYTKPKAATLSNIAAVLYREEDYEVINYAFALFQRWADSQGACFEETRELVRYFLKYMKQFSNWETSYGFGISKTYARSFDKKKYGYGGNYLFYVVGSEKSFAPISFGTFMSLDFMKNFQINLLGVHFRIEGLAKALIRKFKTTDPDTWKLATLQDILQNQMNIRERPNQPVRVQISVMLKGNVIFHRYYDDDSARPDGHIMQFINQLKDLGDEYKINHQRAVQIGGLLYEQPTPIGVPMAVLGSTTTLQSLKATIKKGNHRGLLFRDLEYDFHAFTQSTRLAMLRHPARKVSYGIKNDRIYHVHVPRHVAVGVNPIKREIKLSVSRPPKSNPWRIFMHSQTEVLARGNTVRGDHDISERCPNCEGNRVIVTRGPHAVADRTFVDRDNSKYGYAIKGQYFRCEMDVRKANTLRHLIGAFAPYNKSPKTLWTSVMMGVRQVRAFFLYFPKVEQCGSYLQWSQSTENPTTDIEVTIRGNGEPNGERMFFRGKKIFVKALVKAKGTPHSRTYRVNFAYEYTPGNLQNKVKLQVSRSPVPEIDVAPFSLCFALENKYPDFSPEFLGYDENSDMKVRGKAMVQYGQTESCSAGDGEIRVTFEHSTTAEAREELKNKWYYRKCMEQTNSPQWRGRDTKAVTEECMMTAYDATTARKYTWDVEFVKLSNRMKRISARVKSLVEAGFLPWYDADPEDGEGPDGDIGPFLNLALTFKNSEKNVDVDLETRRGSRKYEDVPLRLNWSSRMRNLKFTKNLRRLFYARIINPCILTTTDVRTNDNVTYSYTPPTCWTLASSKCGPDPEYAVFIKRSTGLPLAARAYVGGHLVEFTPNGNSVSLTVNGSPVSVSSGDKATHTENGKEIFQIFRWGKSYHIYSFLRVWIVYDGHFVEVVPAPSAFGQHCGICGNYNRNQWDEFTGKDLQLKSSADELVRDWQWQC